MIEILLVGMLSLMFFGLGLVVSLIYESYRYFSLSHKIRIKYFDKEITPLEKLDKGDWIDLRSAEEISLKTGEYYPIKLGIGMELPEDYEAIVVPRSSTFKRYHIICPNSVGIIDNSYCGDNDEWHFLVYALRDTVIPKNERICQFRIQRIMGSPKFKNVKELKNANRGGIGSTNKK